MGGEMRDPWKALTKEALSTVPLTPTVRRYVRAWLNAGNSSVVARRYEVSRVAVWRALAAAREAIERQRARAEAKKQSPGPGPGR